jgi:hypothetical protein
MPGRSYQTKPGLPSGCQVNIKSFSAKDTHLGSNYTNIGSLTLVQKVIPGRGLSIIIAEHTCGNSHDLSHGVPLMQAKKTTRVIFPLTKIHDLQ